MRSITFVQAFQYWLKLTALALPVLFLVLAWQGDGGRTPDDGPATFAQRTTVRLGTGATFEVRAPVRVRVDGALDRPGTGAGGTSYAGERTTLAPGTWRVTAAASLTFAAGSPVPHATDLEPSDGADWSRPLSGSGGREHPLYATYSLILAAVPRHHGAAARARALLHQPRRTGGPAHDAGGARACSASSTCCRPSTARSAACTRRTCCSPAAPTPPCCCCPADWSAAHRASCWPRWSTAGAFAAFLSTSSGLTVSVAGVLSQDVLAAASVRDFRLAATVAVLVPLVLSLGAGLARGGRRGRAGLRGGGVDVLPAAGAGHLVARADRRRRRPPGCSPAAGSRRPRCSRRSPASTATAGRARCSPSRRPGPCRSRSPSWCSVSLATPHRRLPGAWRARWSGCTLRRPSGSASGAPDGGMVRRPGA